jgi:DNA-binding CsgD family transcriptional regulator
MYAYAGRWDDHGVAERGVEVHTDTAARVLVGRERELGGIDRFLAAMCEAPSGCLLEGEAGIGKTALWEWTVQSARDKTYEVLAFRASGAEATFAYGGLADLLEPALDRVHSGLSAAQRRAIDVALLRVEGPAERIEPRSVALAVLQTLRMLAVAGPVLVAVDDVQWLDDASARVLAFAIRRLDREPVGVLVSRRQGTEHAPFELARLLATPRLIQQFVGPLGVSDLVELLRRRVPRSVPRADLARAARQAGGNPFYALELARRAESGMALEATPPDLVSLVGERVAALPAATRHALALASAMSAPRLSVIAAALRRPDGRVPSLIRAEQANVITIDADIVRFTHPLLASAVYADASLSERRRCHRLLASAVEDPEEAAEHEARGAEGPSEGIAARLEAAAQRADARGAPEMAAELCARAAALTPANAVPKVIARQIAAARYHARAGDISRARVLLDAVIAAADPGPQRAEALSRLADIVVNGGSFAEARLLLEQALDEAQHDLLLRANIRYALAIVYIRDSERVRAYEILRDLVGHIDELDDADLRVRILSACARVQFLLGRGFDRDPLERAVSAIGWEEYSRAAVSARLHLAVTLVQVGEHSDGRELLDAALSWATRRDETGLSLVMARKAELELDAGNWLRGVELCDSAAEVALSVEQPPVHFRAMSAKCVLLAHLGRVDEAEALVGVLAAGNDVADDLAEFTVRAVRGFIALSSQAFQRAHDEFGGLRDLLEAMETFDPAFYQWLPDDVEALIRMGRLDAARERLDWLAEAGRRLDRPRAIATSARCLALLEQAEGRTTAALEQAEQALQAHDRLPMPFELARTLLVKGGIEVQARRKAPARASLQRALAMFDELGARLWSDWARAELGRVGGRPPSPGRLTATERRIADLVGTGRSNEEVARMLFVSAKTVEWNLAKVYRKLHVRSRTELAARLSKS